MARPRHPIKEIEAAVQAAEELGWDVQISNGHAWGHLYCPLHSRDGCIIPVWSTPGVPENHARGIRRGVARCVHCEKEGDDENT